MVRVRLRTTFWPEMLLASLLVLISAYFLIGSSSAACADWRARLNLLYSSVLSANSVPDSPPDEERQAELQAQVEQVLAERPTGCL